jgi:hypothetical protein
MFNYRSASVADARTAQSRNQDLPPLAAALLPIAIQLLQACSTPAPKPEPTPPVQALSEQPSPEPPSPTERARPRPPRQAKPAPIPDRPLSIATECSFRDETGYAGKVSLVVDQAVVTRFAATISVRQHGQCRFDLKQFRQTREFPTVELRHLRHECTVRLWEQDHRVTVAFEGCQRQCQGRSRDYLWPILADRRNNSCA